MSTIMPGTTRVASMDAARLTRVLSSTRSTTQAPEQRFTAGEALSKSKRSTWAPRASVSSASTKSQGRRNFVTEKWQVRVVSSSHSRVFEVLMPRIAVGPAVDVAQPLPHFVQRRVRLHDVHALAAASSSILPLHLAVLCEAELLRPREQRRRRRHGRAPLLRWRRRRAILMPGRNYDIDRILISGGRENQRIAVAAASRAARHACCPLPEGRGSSAVARWP